MTAAEYETWATTAPLSEVNSIQHQAKLWRATMAWSDRLGGGTAMEELALVCLRFGRQRRPEIYQ